MGVTGRSDSLGLQILLGIILTQLSQGAAEIVCPEIGFLDSPANLSCSGTGRTHSYIRPSGGVVTTCDMNTSACLPDVMVTIPNSSYSVLTLPRVNQSHAGNWTCSIGDYVSRCLMTVAKLPSCEILSNRSTEEVTIRVQDYHCSDSTELYLKTGNFTGRLLNTSRTNITVGRIEITVNVTTSLVESKKLIFVCGNTSWEIACQVFSHCQGYNYHTQESGRNVSRCLMTVAKLPSCDILSSRAAEEVTVRVQDYHCSDSIELYLKTGNFTGRLLNTSRINTTGGMFEITVNVTTSLVETKTLVFVCGNTSWELACQVKAAKESNGSNSSVVIIAAVVAGSVFVIIIIIMLVVILVKMKQSKRKQQPETQTDNSVNDSTYDVMGHNRKSNEDAHKPSACYDRVYIVHAGCTSSPEGDTSIYDVASR